MMSSRYHRVKALLKKLLETASRLAVDPCIFKCRDCRNLPRSPVTGPCGHTRCLECVQSRDVCTCGTRTSENPCVNTVVAAAVSKIHDYLNRYQRCPVPQQNNSIALQWPHAVSRVVETVTWEETQRQIEGSSIFVDKYDRLIYARCLWAKKQYSRAVANYLCVAARPGTGAAVARKKLKILLFELLGLYPPREITISVTRHLKKINCPSWDLSDADFKCVFCLETFKRPVTLPCGHTFCFDCIYKNAEFSELCPLCLRKYDLLLIEMLGENRFIAAALKALGAQPPRTRLHLGVIPIMVCVAPMPFMAYTAAIMHENSCRILRTLLETEEKEFGMIHDTSSRVGTIVRIHDSVQLENGSYMINTVGVARFEIKAIYSVDRVNLAKIRVVHDLQIYADSILARDLACETYHLATAWFHGLGSATIDRIINYFGMMPPLWKGPFGINWLNTEDGPEWLWWLLAVLPISTETQTAAYLTTDLLKRLRIVRASIVRLLDSGMS